MKVEPAHIDQVMSARDGRWVTIGAEAGGVAADLQAIDPGFGVRLALDGNPPFFAVYHQSDDGLTTRLVLTQAAYENAFGVWEGLHQGVVDRVRLIGSDDYDYVAEIEKQNKRAREQKRERFREQLNEQGEKAYHAIRKDLGMKRRAVITTKPDGL